MKNPPSRAATPRNRSEMPPVNGVTWANGDPIVKDGNTTVRLTHSLIVIEQGSTNAKFSIMPQGTGIIVGHIRSSERYNAENHSYVNTDPNNGDKTGNYPAGPPPGMMTNLAPFVQAAMKAINQAKQTPDGATWDDQYFRNFLKPYDTLSASKPR